MTERAIAAAEAAQAAQKDYIREAAGTGTDPATQIAKGQELLKSGSITQQEFDALKAKALAEPTNGQIQEVHHIRCAQSAQGMTSAERTGNSQQKLRTRAGRRTPRWQRPTAVERRRVRGPRIRPRHIVTASTSHGTKATA